MTRLAMLTFLLLVNLVTVMAQMSDTANRRVGSWFSSDMAKSINRLHSLENTDMDLWEAACAKAIPGQTTRADLGLTLIKFDPLFDPKDTKKLGALAKYAKRVEQISLATVNERGALAGADALHAALSLAAEDDLFPAEKFSSRAYQVLLGKFKR